MFASSASAPAPFRRPHQHSRNNNNNNNASLSSVGPAYSRTCAGQGADRFIREQNSLKSTDTATAPAHTTAHCPLLALAPELRNRVYRYVLCEQRAVKIKHDLREPGLLSTCQQIWKEARSIWFLENSFDIIVRRLDITLLRSFYSRQKRQLQIADPRAINITIHPRRRYDWAKLMQWCQAVFDRKVWLLLSDGSTSHSDFTKVVISATETAGVFRDIQGATWEDCRRALDVLRLVAVGLDDRWQDD